MSVNRKSILTQALVGHFWGAFHMVPQWIQVGLIPLSTAVIPSLTCPSGASHASLPHFPLLLLLVYPGTVSQINSRSHVLISKSAFRWRENKTLGYPCLDISFLWNNINNSIQLIVIIIILIIKAKESWRLWGLPLPWRLILSSIRETEPPWASM